MFDVYHKLYIKYGLSGRPSEYEVNQWVALVEKYIQEGTDPELAGAKAARQIFPSFGKFVYASQADTIKTLLDAARRK